MRSPAQTRRPVGNGTGQRRQTARARTRRLAPAPTAPGLCTQRRHFVPLLRRRLLGPSPAVGPCACRVGRPARRGDPCGRPRTARPASARDGTTPPDCSCAHSPSGPSPHRPRTLHPATALRAVAAAQTPRPVPYGRALRLPCPHRPVGATLAVARAPHARRRRGTGQRRQTARARTRRLAPAPTALGLCTQRRHFVPLLRRRLLGPSPTVGPCACRVRTGP